MLKRHASAAGTGRRSLLLRWDYAGVTGFAYQRTGAGSARNQRAMYVGTAPRGRSPRSLHAGRLGGMNPLEDPGRYYWKWLAIGGGLLILYAIERTIRTGALF